MMAMIPRQEILEAQLPPLPKMPNRHPWRPPSRCSAKQTRIFIKAALTTTTARNFPQYYILPQIQAVFD
jgi:hypothetical protein